MKTKLAGKHIFRHATPSTTSQNALLKSLNWCLGSAIDLKLQAKQAHWNLRGTHFIALHELFDKVAKEADEYADLLAERIVQLGGLAEGTLHYVHEASRLDAYPAKTRDEQAHIKALGKNIAKFTEGMRLLIHEASDAGDDVTADICIEVARGMDMLHWFVTAHAE